MNSASKTGGIDLTSLEKSWMNLEKCYEKVRRVDSNYRAGVVFTKRRFEEASDPGERLYFQAAGLLAVAYDHQQALQDMMRSAIHPFSVWGLIRPAFEAAFHVVWILDPDDSQERMRRGLRLAGDELRSRKARDKAGKKVMGGQRNKDVQRRERRNQELGKKFEKEAQALHMGKNLIGKRVDPEKEFPKLESLRIDKVDGNYFYLAWRILSALQHGDMNAVAEVSDISKVIKIPGGWQTSTTVNDDVLISMMQLSMLMQITAIKLYIGRTTSN